MEEGPFQQADLVELRALDPTLRLDIRYATTNNFIKTKVYDQARAFLQRPAAVALVSAHKALAKHGFGLLIFDGYRPWAVTRIFWDKTPPSQRAFVADPKKGSRHNRGCAVDLTMFDLKTGREVPMPSTYDEASERSSPTYAGGPAELRVNRDILRKAMAEVGFSVEPNEWWHFNFNACPRYPILNLDFRSLPGPAPK